MKVTKTLVASGLLTLINVCLYLYKDRFEFVKYSTYDELYAVCDEACVKKWGLFTTAYPSSDIQRARQLLQPFDLNTASTLSKISLIGHQLYTKFYRQAGVPGFKVNKANPVDQYNILATDTAEKLWCGTYAQIFNFLCWSQHIICRSIEIFRPRDHHVFNECYLPERQCWIMVDITNGLLWVKNDNRLLNVQEFLGCLEAKKPVTVARALDTKEQLLADFPAKISIDGYYEKQYPFYYYHITDTKTIYRTASKIKRYIFPVYWYEIFSSVTKPNILFYIKEAFLFLWVLLLVSLFIKRLSK